MLELGRYAHHVCFGGGNKWSVHMISPNIQSKAPTKTYNESLNILYKSNNKGERVGPKNKVVPDNRVSRKNNVGPKSKGRRGVPACARRVLASAV